jgi:hypothetical protein
MVARLITSGQRGGWITKSEQHVYRIVHVEVYCTIGPLFYMRSYSFGHIVSTESEKVSKMKEGKTRGSAREKVFLIVRFQIPTVVFIGQEKSDTGTTHKRA